MEESCPCVCSCHGDGCIEPVTDADRAAEVIGPGGRYVCTWCYAVCEGDE